MSGGEERAGLDLVKEYREADPADWWAGSWELESHYRSKAIMRMEADCFFFPFSFPFLFFFSRTFIFVLLLGCRLYGYAAKQNKSFR